MNTASVAEQRAGYVVLVLLLAIVAWLYQAQQTPNPAVAAAHRAAEMAASSPVPVEVDFPAIPSLQPAGAAESFDAVTLADKIDGRAELYLSAGFQRLRSRRFDAGAGGAWLEVFLYEMTTPDAAYAVFTGQRREGSEPVEIGDEGYATDNALFLVRDQRYVEIIGSEEGLRDALLSAARGVVPSLPATPATSSGRRELLPAADQVQGTLELLTDDAFGFDRLDRVYAARYRDGDKECVLFAATCNDTAEAEGLARGYAEFVLANGGVAGEAVGSGFQPLELFGRFELVFAEGRTVAGVHDATDAGWAVTKAEDLRGHVRGPGGAP